MFKLDLENAEEPEIKSPISVGSSKKQESFRKNICCCFIDYPKAFDSVDHHKLWKILQEMGVPDHLTWLLRNLYAGQEATVRTAMEQQTGSKSGKEYVKAVYCHPAYLTYVQSNPTARHIFWKRWEYQTTWPASWEICMQVRKQQLELDMEQQTGSK